jgi:putative membrane protein
MSFFIEMIGVESGLIFGTYAYGEGLGLKWHDTPLIIGVNWVILVYCSSAILEQYTHWKSVVKILAASALMLLYDVVLEIAAPKMDMWVFNHEEVPIANYVAWFVIAALFHTVIKLLKINIKNPKMDKLLTLYDYCFNNLSLIYTITTNIDDKLKYQDFIKYKLNLDKKETK